MFILPYWWNIYNKVDTTVIGQMKTMLHSKQIQENQTDKIVPTGCLATGYKTGLISTSPLGSCVAVIAYDKMSKIGGIAHVMLPGKSPKKNIANENRYAGNAISNLIKELKFLGTLKTSIEICLVGGANVLRKENDTITKDLLSSIFEIIEQKKLSIVKTSVGGYERCTAKLSLHSGVITFKIGDKNEDELFNFLTDNIGKISHE